MPLSSARFADMPELEACADNDADHLAVGSAGPHVALVQQALIDLGEDLGPAGADGDYGQATATAVVSYKTARSILNAQGAIDDIVGKLTIASLDDEIDDFDTAVTPCLDDRPTGPSLDLSQVGEPAANAVLGLVGLGSLIETDGDGTTTQLLNLASADPGVADVIGTAAVAAVELLGNDPEPARQSLADTLPQVSASPALAVFPTVNADIGTAVQDLVNIVTGAQLIAQLLAQGGAPGTPARDLTKDQALAIAVAAHQTGTITMTPAPVVDASGTITSPAPKATINIGSTIGNVAFKQVQFADKRFAPNHPRFPYNPVTGALLALDVRHLVGMIRIANHLNSTFGVTEVHHAGISGSNSPNGDCHLQGRACDFVGVKGTFNGSAYHLTVLNDWALKSVPNLTNRRSRGFRTGRQGHGRSSFGSTVIPRLTSSRAASSTTCTRSSRRSSRTGRAVRGRQYPPRRSVRSPTS